METINDRMERIVNERFSGNKAAFAKSIGLPPTGLSNYLGNKRRSKPSVDMIAKIVLTLGVDAKWLLTGDSDSTSIATATGTGNVAGNNNVVGSVTIGNASVLQERVSMLEKLLEEKERLIKVLMER